MGKESEVIIDGVVLPERRLKKEIQRYSVELHLDSENYEGMIPLSKSCLDSDFWFRSFKSHLSEQHTSSITIYGLRRIYATKG
jgi:hypothetical protein